MVTSLTRAATSCFLTKAFQPQSLTSNSIRSVSSMSSSLGNRFNKMTISMPMRVVRCSSSVDDSSQSTGSSRGRHAVDLLPSYLSDARAVERYCSENSPNGALQLSVAENQMLEDLLVPAISNFCSGFNQDDPEQISHFTNFYSDQIYYQPTHGRPGLRHNMAIFLKQLLNLDHSRTLIEDNLIMGAGCNAVLENLVFCLAEQGDAVLIPTPYYAAFEFDLVARAGLKIIPVETQHCYQKSNPIPESEPVPKEAYFPTRSSLDAAYDDALKKTGRSPKILLISHPNNPLGICYPKEVVSECISWAKENKVHLVSDEIYAGSVYTKENFTSALTLATSDDSDSEKGLGVGPYVHFVYSLSKDFASSGLRVGVAYTENQSIVLPLQKLNDLCQISSQTQLLVERMLSTSPTEDNKNWPFEFLEENQKRIRNRSNQLTKCLDKLNVPYLEPDSGLFVWMDLREFLPSSEEEPQGAKRERALYMELMHDFGLLFTPGLSMLTAEPGFFRCVFTAATTSEFQLALDRIVKFVSSKRNDS